MRFDVLSIFPDMFQAVTGQGVTGRGHQQGLWSCRVWNPRDFTEDNYRRIDDRPYGGGPGMVMLPGPLGLALDAANRDRAPAAPAPVLLLSPQGRRLDQALVSELASQPALTLIAGRYEALDQRFIDRRVDLEVSAGDFVVSGGELPAMLLIDALVRRIPGVVNDGESVLQDSFEDGLLDCPHYTRPESFEGMEVPAILLSGNHARIARWRRERKLEITARRRPDLIEAARSSGRLDAVDLHFLASLAAQLDKPPVDPL